MSGQEPQGKLDCGFESQARPSGLRHVTLSLGSSAFYLESEVEVVAACLPLELLALLCSALGGKGRALPSPTQFSQQVVGRGGVGGQRPPGRPLPATPAWARFRAAPARLVEACCGSILTLTRGPPPLASCSTASSLCPLGPGMMAASFLFLKHFIGV